MTEELSGLGAVPKYVGLAFVIVLILLGAFVAYRSVRLGALPEEVVEQFVTLIQLDQEDAAYDLMSERYRGHRSYVDFLEDISRMSELRDAQFRTRTVTSRFAPPASTEVVCGNLRSAVPPDRLGKPRLVVKLLTTSNGYAIDALRLKKTQFDESEPVLRSACPPSSL